MNCENKSDEKDNKEVKKLPQKRYYRQRAHSNPIADHCFIYPKNPDEMNWAELYPNFFSETNNNNELQKHVEFLDVGCGYGGLLIKLSELFPDKLSLGLEIRVKVSDYVQERIKALRIQTGLYQNIACLRTNAMKYLPNYFRKQQLSKIFFLFPDPHFKKQKHKWRIISQQLLGEYAYFLKENARVYFVTDVKDLYDWMKSHFDLHPLFKKISDQEYNEDIIIPHLFESSEEGIKVTRNKGEKFYGVYKRVFYEKE